MRMWKSRRIKRSRKRSESVREKLVGRMQEMGLEGARSAQSSGSMMIHVSPPERLRSL